MVAPNSLSLLEHVLKICLLLLELLAHCLVVGLQLFELLALCRVVGLELLELRLKLRLLPLHEVFEEGAYASKGFIVLRFLD